MLFGGQKGHIAMFDNMKLDVGMELQLQEEIHDLKFLQNETMFAAAQNKYTFIYDNKGVEIHCMKRHERPLKLEYLPYHFLLTSVGHSGWIKWHDISIGEYVSGYQTGYGPCRVLKQNPHNAVSHVGHSNGVVTLWSPSAGKALVSMFCHRSPITDLAIDREGRYMATAGLDGYMKIWDLRKFTALHSYKLDHPAVSLDVSDRGLLAIGTGRTMQVLRNAFTQPMDVTYLTHEIRTPNSALAGGAGSVASRKALLSDVKVHTVRFRPLEDIAGIGHSHGITTVIVPGAGEPNFDSFENNPFINTRQRREQEVQTLLNKLSHEMIGLGKTLHIT
jgi:U3 small nucleolar RNA-associated protein 7